LVIDDVVLVAEEEELEVLMTYKDRVTCYLQLWVLQRHQQIIDNGGRFFDQVLGQSLDDVDGPQEMERHLILDDACVHFVHLFGQERSQFQL